MSLPFKIQTQVIEEIFDPLFVKGKLLKLLEGEIKHPLLLKGEAEHLVRLH